MSVRRIRPGPSVGVHGTATGWTRQISSLYCRIVRSEEKKPERAALRIDIRVQPSRSRNAAAARSQQSRYEANPALRSVLDAITSGQFSQGDTELFRPIVDSLLQHDEYLLLADFAPYLECCERAAAAFRDRDGWTRMSILNAARSGFFSSDRTIRQYSEEIWRVQPVAVR